MLADGNPASVGDQVISRANNRALRITAGPQVIKVRHRSSHRLTPSIRWP
jgi:hypothetical protein